VLSVLDAEFYIDKKSNRFLNSPDSFGSRFTRVELATV